MCKKVILDLEFCTIKSKAKKGLQFMNHEVIQVGAVMLDDSMNVIDEYVSFVKPEYTSVTKANHQFNRNKTYDLEKAPCFCQVLSEFLCWIGDDIEDTYIYSWSDIDKQQIENESKEKGIGDARLSTLYNNWCDFQKDFGDLIGYNGQPISLTNALASVDFEFDGMQHDALNDSRNTAKLFSLCADKKEFEKRTKAIRECFMEEEKSRVTIGDMFNNLDIYVCY